MLFLIKEMAVLKMKKHEDECKNDAINVTKLMLQKQ